MIRRYIMPMPGIRLTIGRTKQEVGRIESTAWIGLEIESPEPPTDSTVEEYGLVYADAMTDEELRSMGVTEWQYFTVGALVS